MVRLLMMTAAWFTLSSAASLSQSEDPKELMKLALNLNGLLCAQVVTVTPLQIERQLEVTCIEYRGGTGTVRYIYNTKTGRAFKAN